jgi:hypothetical protein
MSQASDFASVTANIVTLMDGSPLNPMPDSWHTIEDLIPLSAAQQFAVWKKVLKDCPNYLPGRTEVRNTALAMGLAIVWPVPP